MELILTLKLCFKNMADNKPTEYIYLFVKLEKKMKAGFLSFLLTSASQF